MSEYFKDSQQQAQEAVELGYKKIEYSQQQIAGMMEQLLKATPSNLAPMVQQMALQVNELAKQAAAGKDVSSQMAALMVQAKKVKDGNK